MESMLKTSGFGFLGIENIPYWIFNRGHLELLQSKMKFAKSISIKSIFNKIMIPQY